MHAVTHCDIFCRVIDNFGDAGVTLRLARQLADEYDAQVRLIIDDVQTYARIATQACANLEICAWENIQLPCFFVPEESLNTGVFRHNMPTTFLVIEAFGCTLPSHYVEALAVNFGVGTAAGQYFRWLNFEYLSAEDWVETHHLLPSPHPQLPLTKTFFFPGFTECTGGLIRERNLLAQREMFFQQPLPAEPHAGRPAQASPKHQLLEKCGVPQPLLASALHVFLFCYENKALPRLLQAWQSAAQPVVCLLPAERTRAAVSAALGLEPDALPVGEPRQFGALTLLATALVPQPEFDQLLWACDVNFVRGEDSFVRAHWAAKPFCWHVYVQEDGAHLVKLNAFLHQFLANAPPQVAQVMRELFVAWNMQDGDGIAAAWTNFCTNLVAVRSHVETVSARLSSYADCAATIMALLPAAVFKR